MKYNDTFRKIMEDIEKQLDPFRHYEQLYNSGLKDIKQQFMEKERLLHSLSPNITQRCQSLTEIAQKEVQRYEETAFGAKHMLEIVNTTSIASGFIKDFEFLADILLRQLKT